MFCEGSELIDHPHYGNFHLKRRNIVKCTCASHGGLAFLAFTAGNLEPSANPATRCHSVFQSRSDARRRCPSSLAVALHSSVQFPGGNKVPARQ